MQIQQYVQQNTRYQPNAHNAQTRSDRVTYSITPTHTPPLSHTPYTQPLNHTNPQPTHIPSHTPLLPTHPNPHLSHPSPLTPFYPPHTHPTQDFHKPFDAPAVIVVGHQTSGKSALIEALMGFQFNQVGTLSAGGATFATLFSSLFFDPFFPSSLLPYSFLFSFFLFS